MSILSSYDDLIRKVAENNNVPFDLVKQLLALEGEHGNLHGYGARPALRRAIAEIVDAAQDETDTP